MRQLLPLVTGCVTLAGMWLAGSKRTAAWVVGLGNQVLWLAFIVVFAAWGLLPLNFALVVVYTRNLVKWRRENALGAGTLLIPQVRLSEGVDAAEVSDRILEELEAQMGRPVTEGHDASRVGPVLRTPYRTIVRRRERTRSLYPWGRRWFWAVVWPVPEAVRRDPGIISDPWSGPSQTVIELFGHSSVSGDIDGASVEWQEGGFAFTRKGALKRASREGLALLEARAYSTHEVGGGRP